MTGADLEVVWPLHKWHYLSPSLIEMSADMPENPSATPSPAVAVAFDDRPVAPPRRSHHRSAKKPAPKLALKPSNGVPQRDIANGASLQLEALERQQQRILHRTTLIDYVLAAEQRNGAGLTLGDALAELVRDISDAARTIGTILHRPSRP